MWEERKEDREVLLGSWGRGLRGFEGHWKGGRKVQGEFWD